LTDRPSDAHAILAPALEGFSPTPEMPEIADGQALLVTIEAGACEARINTAMGWLSAIADSRARTLVQARGYFERAVTVILANVCRCSATGDRKGRGHRGKSRTPIIATSPESDEAANHDAALVTITH
jgi:hypothetical protein